MSHRDVVTRQLGGLLSVLSHPHRLRIIEEIGAGERDVGSLAAALGISHSGTSQHLSVLRAHRVVEERRDGRHVFYRLRSPALARWLVDGLDFIASDPGEAERLQDAVAHARSLWGGGPAGESEGEEISCRS